MLTFLALGWIPVCSAIYIYRKIKERRDLNEGVREGFKFLMENPKCIFRALGILHNTKEDRK